MQSPGSGEVAVTFGRHANLTFGGGSATIAVLQTEIVERRSWVAQSSFNLAYALSRLTPGTNLLAFCTGVGWLTRGWAGAVVALIASSLPCSILAIAVTALFDIWAHNPFMEAALHGALAAAVCIIVYTCWHLTRSTLSRSNWVRIGCIVAASIALSGVFALSPIRVLLLAALVGAIWPKETTR